MGDAYKGVYSAINWTGVPLTAKFFFQLVFAGFNAELPLITQMIVKTSELVRGSLGAFYYGKGRLAEAAGVAASPAAAASACRTMAAAGLRVPRSFADAIILRELRECRGIAIAVSDADIVDAQRKLGRTEGIYAAPEGAATLVALEKLVRQKWILPHERVVLFNTGSGLKYPD